jgi:hypothetical protein
MQAALTRRVQGAFGPAAPARPARASLVVVNAYGDLPKIGEQRVLQQPGPSFGDVQICCGDDPASASSSALQWDGELMTGEAAWG